MTIPTKIFVSTVVEKNGQLLMIQEGKNNHNQRGQWNFPAGHAEPGESLPTAAAREVKEESGYDVKIEGILSILKQDLDGVMAVIFFFKGSLLHEQPSQHENNILDVRFVPYDEISGLDIRFREIIEVTRIAQTGKLYPLEILIKGGDAA
jgi:8-oxo-dGTP diphosphatase